MYLKSLRVTNYRTHKNTSVEFDRHLTLIGGPNESGKSTLVEAAHRALFLKSRTSGEYQKSMISLHTAEPPEVELKFCKDNHDYTIHKRFAGTRGTALLTSSNGLNLRNDEAEEKLAELLGLQVTRYTPENWAHLWVWQGTSTSNLLNEEVPYRADLLQKLQRLGATGLVQSDLDNRLKSKILESFESIFNKNESFKASSEVSKAEKSRESCQEQWETKRARFHDLKQAAEQYDAADRQLRDINSQMDKQQKVLEKARQDHKLAAEKKQQLADFERVLKDDQNKLIGIETAQKSYDRHQKDKKSAELKLAQLKPTYEIVLQSQKELLDNIAETTAKEAAFHKQLRACRLQANIAQAATQLADQQKELQRLEKLCEQAKACEDERTEFQRRLASIPNLTKKNLQDLGQIDKDVFEAETSLKTMAASIKLLQSDTPVTLNGQLLSSDTDYPISTTTELSIGSGTRILITPGDGTSLAEAQHKLNQLKQRRLEKLDLWKVASYEEAHKLHGEQLDLNQSLKMLEAKLNDLDAEQISKQITDAQTRVARLRSEHERDSDVLASFLVTENITQAGLGTQETWQSSYDNLEGEQQELARLLIEKRVSLEDCRNRIHRLDIEINDCERNIRTAQENMDQEARKLGDPEQREALVTELKQTIATQLEELTKIQNTLDELQPEHLDRLITRHEKSLNQLNQEKETAIATRAGANAKLRSDGSTDIYAELAASESAYQYAQNQFELHQREALGLKLLKELFDAEQQKLSDALTEPFVQRMKKYVQCFTGEIAKISFEVTNKGFNQLRIARPSDNHAPVDFEHLSGGAREQIAAAARLAIAEVLASDSEDGLPIVFDDAFSYSDSRRLDALPLMIEHAIDAGLQIIIVTCNPLQYAALGARNVQLTKQ
jgi:DNA repair exonuclease SbcCD ATPase subunit